MLIRNPHAVGEWRGAWSDSDAAWEQHPAIRAALQLDSKDDGLFWMSKDDFAQRGSDIYVCIIG
jgi:hypothetical protein